MDKLYSSDDLYWPFSWACVFLFFCGFPFPTSISCQVNLHVAKNWFRVFCVELVSLFLTSSLPRVSLSKSDCKEYLLFPLQLISARIIIRTVGQVECAPRLGWTVWISMQESASHAFSSIWVGSHCPVIVDSCISIFLIKKMAYYVAYVFYFSWGYEK